MMLSLSLLLVAAVSVMGDGGPERGRTTVAVVAGGVAAADPTATTTTTTTTRRRSTDPAGTNGRIDAESCRGTGTSRTGSCCKGCDRVASLPGYDAPLPSPWYSGYLSYEFRGRRVHTHYVLVRAENEMDHEKPQKPLIYWSNGGPGASSLFGLFTELGPLVFSDSSLRTDDFRRTGIPTPLYNPYAWTRFGSVLVFDQPAPVGFSYCNNETRSHSCAGLKWTDELASENAHRALRAFYTKFPEYNGTDLYLTGESYGGIYVPTLARRILQDKDGFIRPLLRGFAVGDGCLGTQTEVCGNLDDLGFDLWGVMFLAGHGQIPLSTFHEVLKACQYRGDGGNNTEKDPTTTADFMSQPLPRKGTNPKCDAALSKVKRQAGGFFEYSLYDECTYENGGLRSKPLTGALNDYACGGGPVMEQYLAMDAVKKALHVGNADYFSVDNAQGIDYTPTEPDLRPFYRQLIRENRGNSENNAGGDNNPNVRVLIYNGDADPAITSFAAQNWTSNLGFAINEDWRPWTTDSCRRMGGYVTRYEGNFDFLTVRGAGHMVPTYKPQATFAFLKAWIENDDYPIFNHTCVAPPKPTATKSQATTTSQLLQQNDEKTKRQQQQQQQQPQSLRSSTTINYIQLKE